jgi:hypothetical protein
MALLAGAATFDACIKEKETKVPAIIVQTGGGSDNLMFALQSAGLNENLDAISIGAAIVQLIDIYNVPRKQIADSLEKSPAWLNRMESLCRKLNGEVQKLVAEGQIASRSAQEIARLPGGVQMPFAVSVINNYLSKENVTYLVSRYLNEDTSAEERGRIISTPKMAMPNELKRRNRIYGDNSGSARLSRAIARCIDDNSYLSNLLARIDLAEAAVRMTDVAALSSSLASLHMRLTIIFPRGKNENGGGHD